MPSPDTLATIALVAAVLTAVLAICRTEPGAGPRLVSGLRYHRAADARHCSAWLDAHDVPDDLRDGPYDTAPTWVIAPAGLPEALPISDPNATIPDPFVARTA